MPNADQCRSMPIKNVWKLSDILDQYQESDPVY